MKIGDRGNKIGDKEQMIENIEYNK